MKQTHEFKASSGVTLTHYEPSNGASIEVIERDGGSLSTDTTNVTQATVRVRYAETYNLLEISGYDRNGNHIEHSFFLADDESVTIE